MTSCFAGHNIASFTKTVKLQSEILVSCLYTYDNIVWTIQNSKFASKWVVDYFGHANWVVKI